MISPKPFRQRILFYLLLATLCCVVPSITTMLVIMLTGEREIGMSIAVTPSLVITHYIFSAFFLTTKLLIKLLLPLVTTFIAIVGLKYLLPLRIIHHLFDIYGFWDIAITHLLIAVIIWELAYLGLTKFVRVKQG